MFDLGDLKKVANKTFQQNWLNIGDLKLKKGSKLGKNKQMRKH